MKQFDAHGIRFRYPSDWSVSDESSDDKASVTVHSDGTAFWAVAVFSDATPEQVIDSAAAAYLEDYPDLDAYPLQTTEGSRGPVLTQEIEFVCLELIAAARIDAFRSGKHTVMLLRQGTDAELERHRRALDAMSLSLEVAGPDTAIWSSG